MVVGGNFIECPSNYNTEPSIVRIQLSDFSFKDRTLLKNVPQKIDLVPESSGVNTFRFLNFPSTSHLDVSTDTLWLAFNFEYTGIWKLSIGGNSVVMVSAMQKTYLTDNVYVDANGDTQNDKITNYFSHITKMLSIPGKNIMYLVSEQNGADSMFLRMNLTLPEEYQMGNATILTLTDVRDVQKLAYDDKTEKIYLMAGRTSSRLYQLDIDFQLIEISPECGIDFLKIPAEFGPITSFELDSTTGFIYAAASYMHDRTGVVRIKTNTFECDDEYSMIKFKDRLHNNNLYPLYHVNVTYIKPDRGKIIFATSPIYHYKRIVTMDLLGCIPGRGKDSVNNDCQICPAGRYSDEIGANQCKLCDYGHSTQRSDSIECEKCTPGRYADTNGTSSCFKCVRGTYTEQSGTRLCKQCPVGKYSVTEGSVSFANCMTCEPGKITASPASTACQICPPGKYSEKGEKCSPCPSGKYNELPGISAPNQCKNCPKGRYGPHHISDKSSVTAACEVCGPGRYSLVEGATANITCFPCEAGRYRSAGMSAGSPCAPCEQGKYADIGYVECAACKMGEYIFEVRECLPCSRQIQRRGRDRPT